MSLIERADSPGLKGYTPERVGKWLKPLTNGTEAEKLRLELWCMNERRKKQVEVSRSQRAELEAMQAEIDRYRKALGEISVFAANRTKEAPGFGLIVRATDNALHGQEQ